MNGENTFSSHRPGDRLVIGGAAVFVVGLLATLVTVTPLFLGAERLPTFIYLVAAVATPTGMATALAGMLRGNRARRGGDGRYHP